MDKTRPEASSTPRIWIAALWLAGALFDATQTVFIMHAEGRHHPWGPLFGIELISWVPWMLATPLIMRLARRRPITRSTLAPAIAVHVAAFAAVSALAEAWSSVLLVLFNPWANRRWPTFVDTWSTSLLYQILTFAIAYTLIVTLTVVADARRRAARQSSETARLNEELSRAQLAALLRQIEPHFIFNTLNSIAGLVRDRRNDAAVSMIVGMSEYLRRATEDSNRVEVSLEEELEYVQRYLDIQKVRFGERLQVSVESLPEVRNALVPNLLLQPLVENAIKHGVAQRVAGGRIQIVAARRAGSLCLTVINDGPSLPPEGEAPRIRVGLDNLRTRLRILHGDEADLQLFPLASGGAEVLVSLPFREA